MGSLRIVRSVLRLMSTVLVVASQTRKRTLDLTCDWQVKRHLRRTSGRGAKPDNRPASNVSVFVMDGAT